jgi:TolB-like protein
VSFFDELKKRKVYRTVAAYAVVAFVIMQIIEIVFPMFGIPDWAGRMIIILLFLGLPITIVFSWMYDVGEKGMARAKPMMVEGEADNRSIFARKRSWFIGAVTVVAIMLGYQSSGSIFGYKFGKITDNRQSIAVLPFDNMSEGENDDYFSDGITEDIITYLSKVRGLKVISRTSVMQYKDSKLNIRDIAKELGVANILEGSVRRAGNQVRITGQLIDAKTDEHLWADIYDRKISDIFKVQSEVAKIIASTLGAELSADEAEELASAKEVDPVAYDYYLKRGREGTSNKDELDQSIRYLEKALEYEPKYLDAILALASRHGWIYFLGLDKTTDRLSKYKKYIDLAKSIEPDNPFVSEVEGDYYYRIYRDYSKANELYDKANLESAVSFGRRAWVLRRLGRWDECIEFIWKAIDLDPKRATFYRELGGTYNSVGNYDKALEVLNKSIDLAPNDYETHLNKANWLFLTSLGDLEKSYRAFEDAEIKVGRGKYDWQLINVDIYAGNYQKAHIRLKAIPDEDLVWQSYLLSKNMVKGRLFFLEGKHKEALPHLNKAEKKYERWIDEKPEDFRGYTALSQIKAWLGKKDEAIRYARRATSILPIQKDYLAGPNLVRNLAKVYAIVGENESAIKELEFLSTINHGFYKGEVTLDPSYKNIRKDPRIIALLEK